MNPYGEILPPLTVFLTVWAAVYLLSKAFRLERFGVEVKPFLLIFRTGRFNRMLDWLAGRLGRAVPALSNLSLAMSLGMMALGTYLLTRNLYSLFYRVKEAAPVFPAIPFITIRESLPYFLLAAVVLIAVHEIAHGVVARYEGIKVKSSGVLVAAIIPGGFVEPDEEEFKRAERGKRLRVLAAGSTANMALALLLIPLLLAFFHPSGVLVEGVWDGGPAMQAGIKPGMIIEAVGGVNVSSVQDLSQQISKAGINADLTLRVRLPDGSLKTFHVRTVADPDNPSRPIIGLTKVRNHIPHFQVYLALFWLHFWSLNIAIFNMLPLYPLDGDGIAYNLAEKFLGGRAKIIRVGLTLFYLTLLGLNIGLTFGRFGFISI